MADEATRAIANLGGAGWRYRPSVPAESGVPNALENASPALMTWVNSFSELSSSDDAVWFLSRDDYAVEDADGFAWNACEMLSLEAANTAAAAAEVTAYWRECTPILLSVRGDYAYLAERADGVIVHGTEPEFEVSTVVAPDLTTLLNALDEPGDTAC
ncbi:hypothetical protein [Leucobacter musarum]|uniref:hypothetical protein n=1 Tax=Leucobacter musarum TaxID=1930747 RepID=UPI0006A7A686|nr:hypothetical protein [Leucobacter musarum]